jgi:hypothetical protein
MQLLGNSDSAERSPFEMTEAQRLIKFSMFCGNRRFITVYTRAWKWIMDHMNPARSLTPHILNIRMNILVQFKPISPIMFHYCLPINSEGSYSSIE